MPSQDALAEKEFLLIQELARQPTRTQRELSQNLGLSLGMTNLLIQRLSRKGLIKISQLDWNRTQYLLTLKGVMEKTKKAYSYTLYTLKLFKQIQDNITTALRREYAAGQRRFHLVAQNELLELARDTVDQLGLKDAAFSYYQDYSGLPPEARDVHTATLEAPPPGDKRRYVTLVDFDNISFRL